MGWRAGTVGSNRELMMVEVEVEMMFRRQRHPPNTHAAIYVLSSKYLGCCNRDLSGTVVSIGQNILQLTDNR